MGEAHAEFQGELLVYLPGILHETFVRVVRDVVDTVERVLLEEFRLPISISA